MESENNLDVSLRKLGNFWQGHFHAKSFAGMSLELMKKSSTVRKDFFNKHAFQLAQTGLNVADEILLVQSKILSYIDTEKNKLTLTMKGVVLLEFGLEISDTRNNKFLNDLNRHYFESLMGKSVSPLEAQEKGVIIALLGLLALTPATSVKLSAFNDLYSNTDAFRRCVDKSLSFLTSLGREYEDQTIDKIWKLDVRGEDPVNARLARLNSIALKTDNIYKKSGGHYLNVLNKGNLENEKIEYLFKKVFSHSTLEYEKRVEFVELLQDIFSERYKVINNVPDFNQLEVKYSISECVLTFVQ